jgi:hypothetical protein
MTSLSVRVIFSELPSRLLSFPLLLLSESNFESD